MIHVVSWKETSRKAKKDVAAPQHIAQKQRRKRHGVSMGLPHVQKYLTVAPHAVD